MSVQLSETPSERRRAQQREEARRAILDATEALLLEHGYEAFSMRRLAERCGYTAPTIYHHFGDKAGLMEALLERSFQKLVRSLDGIPGDGDPAETLRGMLDAFLRFGLENPTIYRLLEMLRPLQADRPVQSAEEARALIERPLAALAAGGRLATADLELAVQTIWSMLHGSVSLRISRPDYAWAPGLDAFSLDTLLRGLLVPGEEATS